MFTWTKPPSLWPAEESLGHNVAVRIQTLRFGGIKLKPLIHVPHNASSAVTAMVTPEEGGVRRMSRAHRGGYIWIVTGA